MLIGITGKKRSGKDTFALYLNEHIGYTIYKFADPLKDAILYGLNGIVFKDIEKFTREDLDGTGMDREKDIFSFTETMHVIQFALDYLKIDIDSMKVLDTLKMCFIEKHELRKSGYNAFSIRDLLQIFGTDIVRKLHKDSYWIDCAEKAYLNTDNMIITDCRFDNELKFIASHQGKLFRVIGKDINTDNHVSENGITDFSNTTQIDNKGSLEDLKAIANIIKDEL